MELIAVGELWQSGGCASRPSGVVVHRRVRGSFPGAALLEAARGVMVVSAKLSPAPLLW
jgi:hypothetical protein